MKFSIADVVVVSVAKEWRRRWRHRWRDDRGATTAVMWPTAGQSRRSSYGAAWLPTPEAQSDTPPTRVSPASFFYNLCKS